MPIRTTKSLGNGLSSARPRVAGPPRPRVAASDVGALGRVVVLGAPSNLVTERSRLTSAGLSLLTMIRFW